MKPKISKRWPERSVEAFFDTWNPEMAYILGYFASDGTMYKNKRGACYIAFTSADKDLLVQVKRVMQVLNKIEVYEFKKHHNWKTRYNIQIGSKRIFMRLLNLGFTPKKSLTLNYPLIPDKLLGHFLRGYFDGDGCATFQYYKYKDRVKKRKVLSIRLRCGSKKFIYTLQNKLMNIAVTVKGYIYFHSGAYELVYNSKNVVKLYSFMYPSDNLPCLKRKQEILRRGIKTYGPEV